MFRLLIVVLALSIGTGHAYVLLQVRKGDNQSNVDAVIHKVVKNPKDGSEGRKRLNKGVRYEINNKGRMGDNKGRIDRSSGLESVVLAINTGAAPNQVGVENGVMKKAQELLVDFLRDETVNSFFRAKKDTYNVKPEIVHFRSGKPSLMLEVNFENVLGALKEALRSKKLKTYADTLAQKAAVIYRTLRDDIKPKNKDRSGDNEFL